MTRTVHAALASQTDDYEVRRELHAVPPHVTHEVEFDGKRAVCKLATDPEADVPAEARTIAFVGRETSVPVPRILAVGADHFVAEWHDGVPTERRTDREWAHAAGIGMATLHDETSSAFPKTGLLRSNTRRLSLDGNETWPETVCALLADSREYLAGFGYADIAREVIEFVRRYPDSFSGCGDPVLCHGNLLPDHLGIADGNPACVIDFEHALVGPAEYDYWRTVLPVSAARDRPDLGRAFRAGYESVRALPTGFDRRADLYGMLNGVSYLKALYLQRQMTDAEIERRAERFADRIHATLCELRTTFE